MFQRNILLSSSGLKRERLGLPAASTSFLHGLLFNLKIDVLCSSAPLCSLHTTWHYYPEGHGPHSHCCETLRSNRKYYIKMDNTKTVFYKLMHNNKENVLKITRTVQCNSNGTTVFT